MAALAFALLYLKKARLTPVGHVIKKYLQQSTISAEATSFSASRPLSNYFFCFEVLKVRC